MLNSGNIPNAIRNYLDVIELDFDLIGSKQSKS